MSMNEPIKDITSVLCSTTHIAALLGKDDLLSFSITNKDIFSVLSQFINRELHFRYPGAFKWYQPRKSYVGGFAGCSFETSSLHLQSLFSFDFQLLPPNITHLTFGNNFNQPVDGLLPHSLTHLTFGDSFDDTVDALPLKLLSLRLGLRFNSSVDNLPKTLTYLSLGGDFAGEIYSLPQSLLTLKLDLNVSYDLPVGNLPPKLTKLRIHNSYLLPTLPDSLLFLSVHGWGNTPFPPNLKSLSYYPAEGQTLTFPPSLEALTVIMTTNIAIPPLPPSLLTFSIQGKCTIPPLPASLVSLHLVGGINKEDALRIAREAPDLTNLFLIGGDICLSPGENKTGEVIDASIFPPNLTYLGMDSQYGNLLDLSSLPLLETLAITRIYDPDKQILVSLPPKLKLLIIGKYDLPALPPALQDLFLSYGMIEKFDVPATMRKLALGYKFDRPLPPLPDDLLELNLGNHFNHPLPSPLPSSLEILMVGDDFDQPFPPLPNTLKKLSIGESESELRRCLSYSHPFPTLPPSLTELHCAGQFFLQEGQLTSLPPKLTHLTLQIPPNTTFKLPPLPATLEELVINDETPNDEFFQKWAPFFE